MKGSLVGRGPPQQEALQSTTAGATWGMCSCHQPTVSGTRPHWQPAQSTIVWQTKPWMETCQFKWSRALCILFPQTFNIIITASHLLLSCHLSDRSWGSGWGGDCLMWAVNSWRRKPFSGWPKAKDNLPSGWGGRAGRRSTHSRPQGWFCRWVGRHEPRHLGNPCVQSQRLTVPTLGKIAYVTATQYHPWPNPIRICKQPRRKMKKSLTGVYSCFPDKNNWWVERLMTHKLWPHVEGLAQARSPQRPRISIFKSARIVLYAVTPVVPKFYLQWTVCIKTNEQIKLLGDD